MVPARTAFGPSPFRYLRRGSTFDPFAGVYEWTNPSSTPTPGHPTRPSPSTSSRPPRPSRVRGDATGHGHTDGNGRPDSTRGFLGELALAMRGAAERERERITAEVDAATEAHIEKVRLRAATEAAELRRLAEEDIDGIHAWSKEETIRIREETDFKIGTRREELQSYLIRHAAIIDGEVGHVEGAVRDYRGELDQFFARLVAEDDPAAFAQLADEMPDSARSVQGRWGCPGRGRRRPGRRARCLGCGRCRRRGERRGQRHGRWRVRLRSRAARTGTRARHEHGEWDGERQRGHGGCRRERRAGRSRSRTGAAEAEARSRSRSRSRPRRRGPRPPRRPSPTPAPSRTRLSASGDPLRRRCPRRNPLSRRRLSPRPWLKPRPPRRPRSKRTSPRPEIRGAARAAPATFEPYRERKAQRSGVSPMGSGGEPACPAGRRRPVIQS